MLTTIIPGNCWAHNVSMTNVDPRLDSAVLLRVYLVISKPLCEEVVIAKKLADTFLYLWLALELFGVLTICCGDVVSF